MKRKLINKPSIISCKICNEKFSSYGFPSHLKNIHNIETDEYSKMYGEFRKIKPISKRVIRKVKCKICNSKYSSVGMHTHLRDSHNISINEYVKTHGEFRLKDIKYIDREKSTSTKFECLICKKLFLSERLLSHHIDHVHNISKKLYVKKYVFKNVPQLCKCGCNNEVKLKNQYPYKVDFITGHNSFGSLNGMYNKVHKHSSKMLMRKKAIDRIQYNTSVGNKLSIHTRKSIFNNHYNNSIDVFQKRLDRNNVKNLNTYEDLIDDSKELKFQCTLCNTIIKQHNFEIRCVNCIKSRVSVEEKEIANYIKNTLKLNIIENSRKLLKSGFEIDIFIPEKNIAIEYDGLYWHSEVTGNKSRSYHLNKTKECESVGIKLIHIFSDEYTNNKSAVLSKLKHILNANDGNEIRIGARSVSIMEIDAKTKNDFLQKYHLQGEDRSTVKLGAFYKNELVGVCTFGNLRVALGNKKSKDTYELIRFCVNNNIIVSGLLSKFIKFFTEKNNVNSIISYADKRWTSSKNNVYEKVGFTFISHTPPNYWYLYDYSDRLHRYNFTKSNLIKQGFDSNKSEWQNMQQAGYDRIWDCGNLKYELRFKSPPNQI